MDTQELKRVVEALIFAADEPLSGDRIAETLELENGFDLGVLIEELNREYQEGGRAFTIRQIAGGYQIVTQQNYASWIRKLYLGRQKNRLSHAALETLALIAFKQPISRVDVAQIRGVNSDGVIGTLLERKLVTISGRSETVGRPLLYSTTPEFLKYFGINDIADLPKPREIEELFGKEGMPEELLQALSQTDAQLSLPINADGETAISDDGEIKNIKRSESARPLSSSADIPAETSAVQPPATTSNFETAEAAPENRKAAATVAMPERAAIDINEQVVALIEDSGSAETSSPAVASANENELAWISLNGDTNNQAEHFTGAELSVDGLTEISAALQNSDSATKVVTNNFEAADTLAAAEIAEALSALDSAPKAKSSSIETMMENISADFARTGAVSDSRDDAAASAMVADVEEIVEAVTASFSEATRIVEVNETSLSDFELPPELKSDPAGEIDGWVAEEFSTDEIAEPDFVQKSEDFFLEEAARPALDSAGTITLDENAIASGSEPIVVSTPNLSSITDEIFQNLDGASASINAPEAQNVAENLPKSLPGSPGDATIINFVEPAIVMAIPETRPANFDDAVVSTDLKSEISLIVSVQEPPVANEGGRSAALRARVMGWMKRAFDKFLSLVGAKI